MLKIGRDGFFDEYARLSEMLYNEFSFEISSPKKYEKSLKKSMKEIQRYAKYYSIGIDTILHAIEVELREINILDRMRRPCVYLEGVRGLSPWLESHVYALGGRIVYLDEGFSRYPDLKKEDVDARR
ncbi:MAG: hypothetical protein QMD14_05910 [Candidatus Aenigmarchaeota archaeon]|nr:hypothetical protein [Candidatus Aenigmarchaeota archaeon]